MTGPYILTEAGTTYTPNTNAGSTDREKIFVGGAAAGDPRAMPGAVLAIGDYWYSTGQLAPDPWTYTDLPMVKYSALYRSGDSASDVFGSRLTQNCYVDMTDVSAEIVDFTQGGAAYGIYAPLCHGIYVQPGHQGVLTMRANSSTQVSKVPLQGSGQPCPLFVMRLGPSNGTVHSPVHVQGLTINGSNQAVDPNTGKPHGYHGFVDYRSLNSTFVNMTVKGVPGWWNSPPGETFQFSTYYSTSPVMTNLEVDGINLTGDQVGGGTGNNGSVNIEYDNPYIHDAFVSGMVSSSAGGVGGVDVNGYTTRNGRFWHNANHEPKSGGRNFPGLNHEGVSGFIHHYYPDILMDNLAGDYTGSQHVYIGTGDANCPDVLFFEPNWHPEVGTPFGSNGAFVVNIPATYAGSPNKQTTLPVVIKGGVTLTPVARGVHGDWTKQYMLITT